MIMENSILERLTRDYKKELPPLYVNENFVKENEKNIIVKQVDDLDGLLIDSDNHGFIHSDIWLLQNLNRLNYSDPTALAAMVNERFKERGSADTTKGMSDEDILSTIKSRHIQTLSELNAWIDFVDNNQLTISSNLEKLRTPEPVPEPVPESV